MELQEYFDKIPSTCLSILASDSEVYQDGIFNSADIRTSTLRYNNAKELLKIKNNPQFLLILNAVTCLSIIVEANHDEVSQLIDMVNELKVEGKYLLLIVPSSELSVMRNKTINYNVVIFDKGSGNTILGQITCLCKMYL